MRPGKERGPRGGGWNTGHGSFPITEAGHEKKRRERSEKRALPRVSPAGTSVPVPGSLLQGPPRIPTWKRKAKSCNAWLCSARDVQSKRVVTISLAVSPCQRLENSCDEDTTEIFMGKGHSQSQNAAAGSTLPWLHMGDCSPLSKLSLAYLYFAPGQWDARTGCPTALCWARF